MEGVQIESGNLNDLGYTIQLANSAPLLLPAQVSQICNSTVFHRDIFVFEKKRCVGKVPDNYLWWYFCSITKILLLCSPSGLLDGQPGEESLVSWQCDWILFSSFLLLDTQKISDLYQGIRLLMQIKELWGELCQPPCGLPLFVTKKHRINMAPRGNIII